MKSFFSMAFFMQKVGVYLKVYNNRYLFIYISNQVLLYDDSSIHSWIILQALIIDLEQVDCVLNILVIY